MTATSFIAALLKDTGDRLRAAITAADAGTPLSGVIVPENRHKVPDIDPSHPIVLLRVPRIGRRGLDDTIPAFEFTISFSFDVLIAAGRDAADDLDRRLLDLLDAIDGVLFEDPAWVAQFLSIDTADMEFPEVGHDQYDVALALVSIVGTRQREFPPNVSAPFEGIGITDPEAADVGTKAGVVVAPIAGHPGEQHLINFDFDTPQEGS